MWPKRARDLALLLVPAAVFFLLQVRALDYDFVWADNAEIVKGVIILPADSLSEAFYKPLFAGKEWIETTSQSYYRPLQVIVVSWIHDVFGLQPRSFRLVSLVLGTVTMFLFACFAWLLFRRPAPAAVAALVPAAHPAGLEVYVWIAGISEALATFFLVLNLWLTLLVLRARGSAWRLGLGALSVFALLLALLSKERAVVLPVLLLAMAISLTFREGSATSTTGAAERGGFRALALQLLLANGLVTALYVAWWRPRVLGAVAFPSEFLGGTFGSQLWSAFAIWTRSLGWLMAPLHSTTSDVVRIVTSPLDLSAWVGVLLAGGSLVAWVVLLRRGRPIAALGLAWIWIAYLPISNLVPLLHARAERHVWLSCFGAGLLLADLGPQLLRAAPAQLRRVLVPACAVLAIALLAQRTWSRTPDWRSDLALLERDVARDPYYREGRLWLALTLLEEGRDSEAMRHLETLAEQLPDLPGHHSFIRPDSVALQYCKANLKLGRIRRAEHFVRELEERDPMAIQSRSLRICRAQIRELSGQTEEALRLYLSVVNDKRRPPEPAQILAVARTYVTLRRHSEARKWLARLPSEAAQNPELAREIQRVRSLITGPSPGASR